MNAVVLYESLTGNTRRAAELIGEALSNEGVSTTVCPVTAPDHQALALADLVVVGTWTDGIFVFAQRPARADRLHDIPPITGKRCAVFVTFALNPGKSLEKLTAIMEERGAEVLGGVAIRRDHLDEGARDFVDRVLGAVNA